MTLRFSAIHLTLKVSKLFLRRQAAFFHKFHKEVWVAVAFEFQNQKR